jgi:hypothetical protein
MRKYKFTKFALFRYYEIMDHSNPDEVYLRRWYLIHTPWFGMYLHNILRPDGDRDMHDHPWPFVSAILKGGYVEETPAKFRGWPIGSIHKMKATDAHRIRWIHPNTWSLIFVGLRKRQWGFHTKEGWVYYKTYLGIEEENV